jgi:GST-like protein
MSMREGRGIVTRKAADTPAVVHELVGARTGNCVRAAIALEAAGIPYTVRRIDLAAGQQRSERHLALNPSGKVPVLTGGATAPAFVLTQSNAIVLFAAERAPQALLPGDATARARAYERYFQVVTDIIGPSHAAFRLGTEEGRALLERLAIDGVVALEQVLTHAPYLAGPNFSIADIAGFTITEALARRLDIATLPHIAAWLARVGALPEVRRGLAAFD